MGPGMDAVGAPSGPSNAELIRTAQANLNTRDLTVARSLMDEETVARFPDRTCRGCEEIVAYFEATWAAIDDWRLEILAVAEAGEDVLMHWRMTGTHSGEFGGIAATGKPLRIEGFEHFIVRDGKIVSTQVVSDQLELARQIGMVPPEGSRPDKAMKALFGARTKLFRRFGRTPVPATGSG